MSETPAPPSHPARPRQPLSRRLALTLLPLVLVPLLLMAGAAYLRTRAILRGVASRQITSAAQSQSTLLLTWVEDRQQQLFLSSQRSALRQALAALLPSPAAADDERVEAARAELADIADQPGEDLFTELLVADAASGQVVVATVREWDLQTLASPADLLSGGTSIHTLPAVDNPLVAPDGLALLTVAPMRSGLSDSADLILVGVNRGIALGQLMEELQIFTERSGPYLVRRGFSSFLIPPDTLVRVTGYGGTFEIVRPVEHPVLALDPTPEIRTLEYTDLGGTPVIASAQWFPDWGWSVVNELPQSGVYAELNSLAPFTGAMLAISAILSVVTVALVTGRLMRPLGTLTEFAGRMSRGDWQFRVPEEREDEVGLLAASLNRMAEDLSGVYRSLEQRVEERTRQIRAASEVARAAISTPDLEELLRRAVDLIRERFGYSHASIFLLDDAAENAILRASTGEIGEALISRGHQLKVGSQSIIGWVTANNQPRLASDVSQDPVHFRNELLPATRAEAAVPLQVAGRVLGALDVQSEDPQAFTPDDLAVLQTLADQLSAAIQNARLAQTSAAAADRARLISQVTSQVTGVLEVGEVLRTAAETLHRALGQPEIAIRLLPPGEEQYAAPVEPGDGAGGTPEA